MISVKLRPDFMHIDTNTGNLAKRCTLGTQLTAGKQTDTLPEIFQSGKKKCANCYFKVSHKNFFIGSGWPASLTFIYKKQHQYNFFTSPTESAASSSIPSSSSVALTVTTARPTSAFSSTPTSYSR